MTAIEVFAPAKINLALHVLSRREDGYHDLDTLAAFADLGDRLTLAPSAAPGLAVTGPFGAHVPQGAGNLVLRAATAFGLRGVAVTLEKMLPPAAGLGGGSADAAALLRGAAALTGERGTARRLAPALGADVPMCLVSAPSRARGIGERLTPVALPALAAVLVNPGIALSTPEVFARLGAPSGAALPEPPRFTDAARLIAWLAGTRNDLDPPARRAAPVIGEVLAALGRTGAALARMSGSGATCFGLYATAPAAAAAAARLSAARPDWWVSRVTLGDMSALARPRAV